MSDEKKRAAKPLERVTIDPSLKEKLIRLTEQASAAMQGIASITKSDLVNMFLEDHAEELSAREIERLKATHIDQVKLAQWLADEMRSAKRAGESVTLKELLERCELALTKPRAEKRTRKKKTENLDPENFVPQDA